VSGAETLEQLRRELAPGIAGAAAFDGWSEAAVRVAAQSAGVVPELALLAFEQADGSLAMAMIAAWIGSIDESMAVALPVEALAGLPVRERMGRLIRFRLDALGGCEEALRRALAILAMPRNLVAAARLGWGSADAMWRLAGDTAADYNHYTKRATLAAIYAATLAVFAGDTSEGKAETLAFLDRRIAGVMRFEKAKGRLFSGDGTGHFSAHFSPARFLGRLRYPVR
jgi:ubiquinone biosynthesis protein COQ9